MQKRCYLQSDGTLLVTESYKHYFLCLGSEETVSFFLPLALRRANTLRPFAVAIRSLKPCLFLLFLLEG